MRRIVTFNKFNIINENIDLSTHKFTIDGLDGLEFWIEPLSINNNDIYSYRVGYDRYWFIQDNKDNMSINEAIEKSKLRLINLFKNGVPNFNPTEGDKFVLLEDMRFRYGSDTSNHGNNLDGITLNKGDEIIFWDNVFQSGSIYRSDKLPDENLIGDAIWSLLFNNKVI